MNKNLTLGLTLLAIIFGIPTIWMILEAGFIVAMKIVGATFILLVLGTIIAHFITEGLKEK